jgi:predicted phosphodiesterase
MITPLNLAGSWSGLLAIGDPHVSSVRPGRRTDEDFIATVTDKLAQAALIANERNLLPVILGDLFDREQDTHPRLLTRLFRALRKFETTPLCLVGNHDLKETALSEDTALSVVLEAGAIRAVEGNGVFYFAELDGTLVRLGATTYGLKMPTAVAEDFSGPTVWFTHADWGFEGAYPGADEIFEVPGVDLVINGHMHLTKPAVRRGRTLWFNPGNILRQRIDATDHVPSVWEWSPLRGAEFLRHVLTHKKEVFDLTGRLAPTIGVATQPQTEVQAVEVQSLFADLLKVEAETDQARSQDGTILREDLQKEFVEQGAPESLQARLLDLFNKAQVTFTR